MINVLRRPHRCPTTPPSSPRLAPSAPYEAEAPSLISLRPPLLPPEAVLGGVFPRKLICSPPHFIDRLSQWIIEVTEITSDPDTAARSKVELSHFVRQSLKLAARDFFQPSSADSTAHNSHSAAASKYTGVWIDKTLDLSSKKRTCIPVNKTRCSKFE